MGLTFSIFINKIFRVYSHPELDSGSVAVKADINEQIPKPPNWSGQEVWNDIRSMGNFLHVIRSLTILLIILLYTTNTQAQDTTKISPQLYLIKYSEQLYMHVSKRVDPKWGSFTCNGMVLISEPSKVWLYDTPMDDSITLQLYNWIATSLNCEVEALIPNHFHDDCIGGLDVLAEQNPKIYVIANKLTYDLLGNDIKDLGLLFFLFDDISPFEKVQRYYLGPGHATDNIVAWFPEEKVLFAGCMLKAAENQSIGFVGSADIKKWPQTIRKVRRKFKKAKVVIPGHGNPGDISLFKHTLKLLKAL